MLFKDESHEKEALMYKKIGDLMRRFTNGPLPKALKMIHTLNNWEEVLKLTKPKQWTPQAVVKITTIFASNFTNSMLKRFYNQILLPLIRNDIKRSKKLNTILFQALKKAIYKPSAFYQGILIPLCLSRTSTLREAIIISSVLQSTTVPAIHSITTLLQLIEMEYCNTTSFFIRALLKRNYTLTHDIVESVIKYFIKFRTDVKILPVIWHQTLLTFVQKYSSNICASSREAIKSLTKIQFHTQISPLIHRELDEN
jgi:essential nuclear protein 1